jgi:hypothetical protein
MILPANLPLGKFFVQWQFIPVKFRRSVPALFDILCGTSRNTQQE